eukprot:GGOE01007250.1.p3 GENE.GGOE01007250.1~~GGOE01007250.1.p3  ORF type:complete len:136 (+),score=18.37 GGOE01007250.1:73-480(+)
MDPSPTPLAVVRPPSRPVVIANNWYELAMVTPTPPPSAKSIQTISEVPHPEVQRSTSAPGYSVMSFVDGQNWHELNMLRGAVRLPKKAPSAVAPSWDAPRVCEPSPFPRQVQVIHAQLDALTAQQKVTLLSQQVF